jgi:hypothetical protein
MIFGANSFCPAQWLNNPETEVKRDEIRNQRIIKPGKGKKRAPLRSGSAEAL